MNKILYLMTALIIVGCGELNSGIKYGVKGAPGQQTPVKIDTEGNPYGYYEYLPKSFSNTSEKIPLIFYWNGSNAITGDGENDLPNLLTQGLPQYINEGRHYPALIISTMLPKWQKDDIHKFVEYVFKRYENIIDSTRVYMIGFSAGGGVTMRYIQDHPEKFAAIIPIAPAAKPPGDNINSDLVNVSSWFFHNSGDMKVEIWRSNQWHNALKNLGGERKITRPDLDSHYAWQAAFDSSETWSWLFSQTRDNK